ncbi:MAG: DUF1573 domain-containing protein [Candidatus Zixiibacteriota bacterium]
MAEGSGVKRADRSFGLLLVVVTVLAAAATVLAGPQLEIINPTTDFGKVPQNKVVSTDFFIKSIGDEPLKILTLWSGCGCADIPLTDSTIDPGDSLKLTITFSTGRELGRTLKKPSVVTNAFTDVIKLSIAAEVVLSLEDADPVGVTPDVVDVSQYGGKTRRIGHFSFENKSSEDFRILVVDSARKSFEVRVPDMLKAGQTVEGKLRVIDSKVDKDFQESVTFRFEGKEGYNYTLPVVRHYRPENPAQQ